MLGCAFFISACKSITNIISCDLTFYFPERPRCQFLVNFAGTVDFKSPLRHYFSVSRRCRIYYAAWGFRGSLRVELSTSILRSGVTNEDEKVQQL